MRYEFEFGRGSRRGQRPRAEATTRILVIADLMGAPQAPPFDQRPLVALDVEQFDEAFARFAPSVALADLGVEGPLTFACLDDFHPDRLVERVAVFDRLRDLRRRLQHPSTFRDAAAELASEARAAPTPPGESATPADDGETTFERLLGAKAPPAATTGGRVAISGDHPTLDAFIRSIIAPHIVAAADPQLPQLLSAVDTALSDTMRAVLHHPALQRLEATWRGVRWLLTRAEGTDDHAIEIVLLHVAAEQLRSPDTLDALRRRLVPIGADASPWSLIVSDVVVGPSPPDLELLGCLARLAADLDTPLLAAASGRLLGCDDVSSQPDPASWVVLPDADEAWADVRSTPAARFVGLVWPRVLLRLPYGRTTDPIEAFGFEEVPPSHAHEDFLWGNGAFAAALAMVREAVGSDGDEGDIDDLPACVHTVNGETMLKACAEAFLPERAIDAVLRRGVMPLVSYRHRNAARLIRVQSIAGTALPPARSLS